MKLIICSVGLSFAFTVTSCIAQADTPSIPGHAIVARAGGSALVIWDATPEIASIVKDKVEDVAANDRLQRDALNELALEQPKLTSATAVTVRVIYTKSGDVSPVYGTPTFAGVERYATVMLTAADAKSDRDKWKEAAASTGKLPSWIQWTVLGQLPPRQ